MRDNRWCSRVIAPPIMQSLLHCLSMTIIQWTSSHFITNQTRENLSSAHLTVSHEYSITFCRARFTAIYCTFSSTGPHDHPLNACLMSCAIYHLTNEQELTHSRISHSVSLAHHFFQDNLHPLPLLTVFFLTNTRKQSLHDIGCTRFTVNNNQCLSSFSPAKSGRGNYKSISDAIKR